MKCILSKALVGQEGRAIGDHFLGNTACRIWRFLSEVSLFWVSIAIEAGVLYALEDGLC